MKFAKYEQPTITLAMYFEISLVNNYREGELNTKQKIQKTYRKYSLLSAKWADEPLICCISGCQALYFLRFSFCENQGKIIKLKTPAVIDLCSNILLNKRRISKQNYGQRTFSFAAPFLWNSLPVHNRQASSFFSLKFL